MNMIRAYTPQDKEKLVELLRLNTPAYFDPSEEKDFLYYLDHELESYFVVEDGGTVVGCGGFNYAGNPNVVRISWDIMHPDAQGKGWGSELTRYRINKIKENPEVELISVRTTQLVYTFYQKFGFRTKEVVKDFWAKGFDLYRMELPINLGA